MDVRPATVADVDRIAAVHRLSRAAYYGSSPDDRDGREVMWVHFLGEPFRVTYVAETSCRVEGVMSARRSVAGEGALELAAIYVHPSRFREGIGSRLYQVFDELREDGEAGVLEVWEGNHRAVDFYERRGWLRTDAARPGPQDLPFVTYRLGARPAP